MQLGNLQNLGNILKSLQWIPELIGSTIYRFESVLWWIYWSGYHGLPSKCWPISMKKLWNSHSWWWKPQVSSVKVSQKIITPTAQWHNPRFVRVHSGLYNCGQCRCVAWSHWSWWMGSGQPLIPHLQHSQLKLFWWKISEWQISYNIYYNTQSICMKVLNETEWRIQQKMHAMTDESSQVRFPSWLGREAPGTAHAARLSHHEPGAMAVFCRLPCWVVGVWVNTRDHQRPKKMTSRSSWAEITDLMEKALRVSMCCWSNKIRME